MDDGCESEATMAALHMNEYVEWVSTLCACINVWNIMNYEHDTWLETDGEDISILNMYIHFFERYFIYWSVFSRGRWGLSSPCVVTQMVPLLVAICCVYLYTTRFSMMCKFPCTLLHISVRPYVIFQPASPVSACRWCHRASRAGTSPAVPQHENNACGNSPFHLPAGLASSQACQLWNKYESRMGGGIMKSLCQSTWRGLIDAEEKEVVKKEKGKDRGMSGQRRRHDWGASERNEKRRRDSCRLEGRLTDERMEAVAWQRRR